MSAAPAAVAPPPGHPRFPLVDGLRAMAALAIVVTHTANESAFNTQSSLGPLTERLDSGIAVFFVISGFLLYRPFAAARLEGRPRPSAGRYLRRRALRILPAYWVALTIFGATGWAAGVFGPHWWAYYGLVQEFHSSWILSGLGIAWTLGVEASFYLALPIYAALAERCLARRDPRTQVRAELAAILALGGLSLAARMLVYHDDRGASFSFTLGGMFLWLALGMALAVLSAGLSGRPESEHPALVRLVARLPGACWVAAAGLLAFCAWGAGWPHDTSFTTAQWGAQHLLYGAFGLLLVAPAVLGRRGVPAAVLRNPVIAWLGLVSYGIFLYHLPFTIHLLSTGGHGGYVVYTLVVAAVATACAAASYYIVERPFLRLKETGRAS